jgi:hypothetical protein
MPDEIYTLNERQHYQQTYPLNSISNPYPKNNIIPLEGKNSDIKIYPPLPNNKK